MHVPQDLCISVGILDSTHIKQCDEVLIFGGSEVKMITQNLANLIYSVCDPFRYMGLGHEHFLLYTFQYNYSFNLSFDTRYKHCEVKN
jgi:hypothetical protein